MAAAAPPAAAARRQPAACAAGPVLPPSRRKKQHAPLLPAPSRLSAQPQPQLPAADLQQCRQRQQLRRRPRTVCRADATSSAAAGSARDADDSASRPSPMLKQVHTGSLPGPMPGGGRAVACPLHAASHAACHPPGVAAAMPESSCLLRGAQVVSSAHLHAANRVPLLPADLPCRPAGLSSARWRCWQRGQTTRQCGWQGSSCSLCWPLCLW